MRRRLIPDGLLETEPVNTAADMNSFGSRVSLKVNANSSKP